MSGEDGEAEVGHQVEESEELAGGDAGEAEVDEEGESADKSGKKGKKNRKWAKAVLSDFWQPEAYVPGKGSSGKGKGEKGEKGEKGGYGKGKGRGGKGGEKGGDKGDRGDRGGGQNGNAEPSQGGVAGLPPRREGAYVPPVPVDGGATMGEDGDKGKGRGRGNRGGGRGFDGFGGKGGMAKNGVGGPDGRKSSGGGKGRGFGGPGGMPMESGKPEAALGSLGADQMSRGGLSSPSGGGKGCMKGMQMMAMPGGPAPGPGGPGGCPGGAVPMMMPAGAGPPGKGGAPFPGGAMPFSPYGMQGFGGMPGQAMYMPYAFVMPAGGGFPGSPSGGPQGPMPAGAPAQGAAPPLPGGNSIPPNMSGVPFSQPTPIGTVSSADNGVLKNQVKAQIEYYFSTDNLHKDIYLRMQMNEEGWVAVALLSNFQRISSLTKDQSIILEAIAASQVVELDATKYNVRAREEWQNWTLGQKGGPSQEGGAPMNPQASDSAAAPAASD